MIQKFKRGAALIEFAIVLPVLILLSFGAFEVHRFVHFQIDVKRIAYSLGMWVSRDASSSFVDNCFSILTQDYADLKLGEDCQIIVTGINTGQGSQNTVLWTKRLGLNAISSVSTSNPVLYHVSHYSDHIQSIVIEVQYDYKPLFFPFAEKTIKYQAVIDNRGADFA